MAPGRADAELVSARLWPGGPWEERGLAPDRLLGKSPPLPPERGDRARVEVPASQRPWAPGGGAARLLGAGQVPGGPASAPWEAHCRWLHRHRRGQPGVGLRSA